VRVQLLFKGLSLSLVISIDDADNQPGQMIGDIIFGQVLATQQQEILARIYIAHFDVPNQIQQRLFDEIDPCPGQMFCTNNI